MQSLYNFNGTISAQAIGTEQTTEHNQEGTARRSKQNESTANVALLCPDALFPNPTDTTSETPVVRILLSCLVDAAKQWVVGVVSKVKL
jgi:hypothetical protein